MAPVVPQDPTADVCSADVEEEMVGKPVQVTARKSPWIEMEAPGILLRFAQPNLKLGEEVFPKPLRHS